jgi:hypothetical protein
MIQVDANEQIRMREQLLRELKRSSDRGQEIKKAICRLKTLVGVRFCCWKLVLTIASAREIVLRVFYAQYRPQRELVFDASFVGLFQIHAKLSIVLADAFGALRLMVASYLGETSLPFLIT